MNRSDFEAGLKRDGYAEVVERTMEPNAINDQHSHDFDARVLILEGEFTLTCAGTERRYTAGEMFEVPLGAPHIERAGASAIRYVAGRRRPR